jgi:hypothetical protein
MNKPHIVESQVAIEEGNSLTALCGALIRRSRFVAMDDTSYIPGERASESHPRGVCQKCLKVRTFRYVVQECDEVD